jgi:hypothetical protein
MNSDPARHPLGEPVEDAGRVGRRRSPAELDDIPAGNDVTGGELLPDLAGQRPDVEGVELDQVARSLDGPGGRPADRVRSRPAPLADAHPAPDRLAQLAGPPEAGEDPSDHRDRQAQPDPPEEDRELVLAPARIGLADRPDGRQLVARPGRSTPSARGRRAILEALEVEPVEPLQPAIDGRPGKAEVTGGPADIGAVAAVPVDHREAGPGGPAEISRREPAEGLERARDEDRRGMLPAAPHAAGRLRHREPPLLLMF